jgi:hypothetical protein
VTQPPSLAALLRELDGRDHHRPHDPLVRLTVRLRARDACEYCLMPTSGPFHIDHVISPLLWEDYLAGRLRPVRPQVDRRGPDHLDNYAWSCPFCNLAKAQQVAHRAGRRRYRLYDPRRDRWPEHFVFVHNYLFIVGLPGIGQATEHALRFNDPGPARSLGTRHDAILLGQYPPHWATDWLIASQP